jgi:hypothetical protein
MYRVLIEQDGKVTYQLNVSSRAYAVFEARELAYEANGVKVDPASDMARYQTKNGVIRAITC